MIADTEFQWRKMVMIHKRAILVTAGIAGILWVPTQAAAQNACPSVQIACGDTTKLPAPIYMAGSSAFEPILGLLAVRIQKKQGVSIIYSPISSCNGVSAISPPAESPTLQPLTGTAHYYIEDPTDSTKMAACSCNLAGNNFADIGVSDVSFESCQGVAKPAGVGEWLGPEQAMLIVVPKGNLTTTALSAEQAGAIWGCGPLGNVAPFIDNTEIFCRTSSSGTQILVARNIGNSATTPPVFVPESSLTSDKCTSTSSSSDMLTRLVNAAEPQKAIGFIAVDFYATHRSSINPVAFRGLRQKKAYYPDSTSIADDLLNVREGRYMIQGPLHFFSALVGTQPSASAGQVLNWLTGDAQIDSANPGFYINTVASSGDVPQCAMKVKISKDGGYFAPYSPSSPCNCAFEKAKSLPTPGRCGTTCSSDAACAASGLHCQNGYCE